MKTRYRTKARSRKEIATLSTTFALCACCLVVSLIPPLLRKPAMAQTTEATAQQ